MRIRRPVQVKLILTESTRNRFLEEIEEQVKRLRMELEQLQFQGKKLLSDAQRRGPAAVEMVRERLAREERARRERIEALKAQAEQLRALPEGSEVLYTTVESDVEIRVGDDWNDLMNGAEIVIKDGVVVAIRDGRMPDGSETV
ncbi:MAG TPA: YlqD family protein [Calditerricola sp.]